MYRDIGKLIQAYADKYLNQPENTNKGKFYVTDAQQLLDRSHLRGIPDPLGTMILTAVFESLEAGYMIGYRTAQRDARRSKSDRDQKKSA